MVDFNFNSVFGVPSSSESGFLNRNETVIERIRTIVESAELVSPGIPLPTQLRPSAEVIDAAAEQALKATQNPVDSVKVEAAPVTPVIPLPSRVIPEPEASAPNSAHTAQLYQFPQKPLAESKVTPSPSPLSPEEAALQAVWAIHDEIDGVDQRAA